MSATYNEIDDHAARWTRNLIDAGLVCPGVVDERSIATLRVQDLDGRAQFHTFSGIAVWSAALRGAGWPDDCEVWSGSAPCQPFSTAGRGRGLDDERHLWPEWFRLIRECRPPVVLGEQVASPDGLKWLDVVLADLEGAGYACAAFDLPAASVGAPHIRQRIYFVAVADGERLEGVRVHLRQRRSLAALPQVGGRGAPDLVGDPGLARGGRDAGAVPGAQGEGAGQRFLAGDLAQEPVPAGAVDGDARRGLADDALGGRVQGSAELLGAPGQDRARHRDGSSARGLADSDGDHWSRWLAQSHGREAVEPDPHGPAGGAASGGVADAGSERRERREGTAPRRVDDGSPAGRQQGDDGPVGDGEARALGPGPTAGFWADAEWIPCRDGKARPTQPGLFPLAHGSPTRVGPDGAVESQSRSGRLKGYGNAIVRPLAQVFIESVIDVLVGHE